MKDLLGEINPQLLATITSEFDKVEGEQAPEPTRTSVDVLAMGTTSSGKGGSANAAMDDLFPRVEIDSLLKGTTILSGAKNDAWKSKKEALETLQAILDQGPNKRLKPSMGEFLFLVDTCDATHIYSRRRDRTCPEEPSNGYKQSCPSLSS